LSSLEKEPIELNVAATEPIMESIPSYVTKEIIQVAATKRYMKYLEVENIEVVKRAAATSPRHAAVQWPNNMK